ncbi:hypothetical protein CBR_g27772 [Chara braunii]|uniref:HAT C-terminal dimerisation domain-containing protein n=1 Tax=Chara braunii TaxID=69332 RepID=A0A388L8B6_CHABU|nr:hypothetical protein CBR_g27772 [Chara braunii]|eukprot:GBG78546.1 hypothetical protein CBR_g27772 [Chara braunii]
MTAVWSPLQDFHGKYSTPGHWGEPVEDAEIEQPDFDPVKWGRFQGVEHRILRDVAMLCLGAWTTASPCERNWSTHDFMHTKRLLQRSHERGGFIGAGLPGVGLTDVERRSEDYSRFEPDVMAPGTYDPTEIELEANRLRRQSRGRRLAWAAVVLAHKIRQQGDDTTHGEDVIDDDVSWLSGPYREDGFSDAEAPATVSPADDGIGGNGMGGQVDAATAATQESHQPREPATRSPALAALEGTLQPSFMAGTVEGMSSACPSAAAATFSSPHRAVEYDSEGRLRRRVSFTGPLDLWTASAVCHDAEKDLATYLPRPLSDLPRVDPDAETAGVDCGEPIGGDAAVGEAAAREGGAERKGIMHDLAAAGYSAEEIEQALAGYPGRQRQGTPQQGMRTRHGADGGTALFPPRISAHGRRCHCRPETPQSSSSRFDHSLVASGSQRVSRDKSPGKLQVVAEAKADHRERGGARARGICQDRYARVGRRRGEGRPKGRPPGLGRGVGRAMTRGGGAPQRRAPADGSLRGVHADAAPVTSSSTEDKESIALRITRRHRGEATTRAARASAASSGSSTSASSRDPDFEGGVEEDKEEAEVDADIAAGEGDMSG